MPKRIDDDVIEVKLTQKRPNANLKSDQWGSLRSMYRDMNPDITYGTFYNRIKNGMDPMSAATTPRDPRGRKRITFS